METKYVHLQLPVAIAAEVELNKNNMLRQEEVIKNFFKGERDFIEDQLREMDELTVKYASKLIAVRDAFKDEAVKHEKIIEELYVTARDKFDSLDGIADAVRNKIGNSANSLTTLMDRVDKIDHTKLTRLIEAVERWERMGDSEKELIKLVIEKS